jgi:epoxyqueuosine reductase QueG
MINKIFEILNSRGITLSAPIPLSACKITKEYKILRAGFSLDRELCAIMLAVPYLTEQVTRNISAYAVSRDYHLYFKELFAGVIALLKSEFPEYRFEGFTDHSPIDEINAAALSGLGIIGTNGLLITKKYSSFVFVGEIVTNAEIDYKKHDIVLCENCGLCLHACPTGCDKSGCLSAVTQKKGELTKDEAELIVSHRIAWGCDLCQKVCPHTKKAIESGSIYSDLPFFKQKRTPYLTYDIINEMSEDEFKERAYSWRGKPTLLRNLSLLENLESSDK